MFIQHSARARYAGGVGLVLLGSACGPKTQPAESLAQGPAHSTHEQIAPAPSADRTSMSAGDAGAASAGEPAPEETEAEAVDDAPQQPVGPPLSKLCETMCGAQSAKCSEKQVKACEQNYCYRYGTAPAACEPSVRSALVCAQADPNFLLCANVVPDSCAKRFRAAEDCVATGVPPEPEQAESTVPAGWAKYQAPEADFTVLMPKDVTVETKDGVRIWKASSGEVNYEIRREPLPAEKKYDQRAFLRMATKLLGPCAPKMKLYALIEREDRDMIQFKTTCKDGTQRRGMLYVQGDDYFVLEATWPSGDNPDADTFAFSFVRP